jgi:hypothetical protein
VIAEAVFERINVLGATDFTFMLIAHANAHGGDAAFGAGDQSISIGQSGRGARSQADAIRTVRQDRAPRPTRQLAVAR